MADDGFKLPGSSYEELVKIMRAYGAADPEATPEDVGRLAGMHPTQVSRNNGFLVAIGAIDGGRKKSITEKGKRLAHALDHVVLDEILNSWRSIVLGNDFLSKLLTAVRIRQGMEPSTLQAHVAYSAGQAKSRSVMTGAGAVVDILKAAGLLREQDGKLIAAEGPVSGEHVSVSVSSKVDARDDAALRLQESASVVRRDTSEHPAALPIAGMHVSIQIQLQCTAADIEQLGPRLRQLVEELSRPAPSSSDNKG